MRPAATDAAGLGSRRALAFVAPALMMIALFLVFPALWSIYLGVTDYKLTGPEAADSQFVGWDNYSKALSDEGFYAPLGRTLIFVFGSAIIGQNVLGFALAWMLRTASKRLRALVESFVLLAWILPGVVVAFLWIAFLKNEGGTLNTILGTEGTSWLLDHPMASLIVFNTWRGTAFSMMLYSAALASVPPSHIETARLAGARGWQQIRDVVFPHVRGHVLTSTLLISLWTFNDFTPYLLTKGHPEGSVILPVQVYLTALGPAGELGYASAIALIMLVVNLILAAFYIKLLRRKSVENPDIAVEVVPSKGPDSAGGAALAGRQVK